MNTPCCAALIAVGLAGPSLVVAAPLTLTGSFVQVGVSDFGTLGSNGSASPGIRHDATGTGNFTPGGVANDYLTPGTPSEAFALVSAQTGFVINSNVGISGFGAASPSTTGAVPYDNAATWMGGIADLVEISHLYYFNNGDERVNIRTTITALADLTDVAFGRHLDPDPDVNRFGSFSTLNTRGNNLFAPEDLVSAAGQSTGLTIGLLDRNTTYSSNTGISGACCSIDNPNNVLAGYGPTFPATNVGDFGLQMAWFIGSLALGESAVLEYAYVMGERQGDVGGGGGGGTVPEPASALLLGLGALLILRRRP